MGRLISDRMSYRNHYMCSGEAISYQWVKGRKKKGLGLWMLSEARPMGTIGQESTHFFIGLSAVETFNNFAQSYKIFNDCDFCYTPVI